MDWIKKNSIQFALLVVAALAIISAAILFMKVFSFSSGLETSSAPPPPGGKTEIFSTDAIEKAQKAIDSPAVWQPAKDSGRLFVSRKYVYKDGKLIRPEDGMFNPPVPNKWLFDYGLDPLSAKVLGEDPDKDGFTTREEWDGMDAVSHLDDNGQPAIGPDGQPLPNDSTNPMDPKSHPPYSTKLQLDRIVSFSFRLQFKAHDYDPRRPDRVQVQLNTVDRGNRTYFLGLGEKVLGTKFSTKSFQFKEVDSTDGTRKDVSELTVVDDESGKTITLPLGQVVDSPDRQAVFHYLWVEPGKQQDTLKFAKKKDDTFQLPPEIAPQSDKTYKLIDIMGSEVVVELPTGERKTFKVTK
jgi:hypothetical protein